MKKRLLSILLTFIMILNVAPISVSADEVTESTYTATFQGHSAQVNSFKLYTYAADGTKGETDLLDGVEDTDSSYPQVYSKDLPAGDYWLEGYDESGVCSGGIKITVTADGDNLFNVQRAYHLKASNSGWVLGTDYTIDVEVTEADRTPRVIEMGTAADYSGNMLPSCICLYGDTVTVTYAPTEIRVAENYIEAFKNATMTASSSSLSITIPQAVEVTFEAPEGSVVEAGQFHTYYIYDFAEPKAVETQDGENVSYSFMIPKNTEWFYRVKNPNGVTYWDFGKWSENSTVTITEEDLCIGSTDFNKETISRFDRNVYDRADIYLNINGKGYMDMDVNESYELNVFRNWMAIESFYNNRVALPDISYEVIDVNGNPSDILTIVPDEKNSSVAKMTATEEGTAIVLVTYDAMIHMQGMGGKQFSAIWPECTGVFVVTVGAGEADIDTGMIMERYAATDTAIDAEHDILFYVGDEGAEFTFTPEEESSVSILHPTLTESAMTYDGGFTRDGVTVDSTTGEVTLSGLTTGRHIVKVENGDNATYQVITARGVNYEIQDANGNALTEEQIAAIKAGDTIYLQFRDLLNPAEKLQGAYNMNASIYFVGENETIFTSNAGSVFGVYDFSSNPERQKVAITIPKYWDNNSYSLSGAIKMGGFANVSVGEHRGITYARGLNPSYDAPTVGGILAAMPEVTFNLAETDFLTGTLTFKDQDGNPVSGDVISRVDMKDADGNVITVGEDFTFKCVAEEYSYVIYAAGYQYKTGTVTVTADGTNTFEIVLQTSSESAWDGVSATEPETDENGVFQIETGSELAWFAQHVNEGNASVNAVLGADINLAGYPWTAIGTSSKQFKGNFDGNGHSVNNVYMNTTTDYSGLFGYASTGSAIRNLTVDGELTTTKQYSAGIVAYLNGGTVENCTNNVTVSSTANIAGGIAGWVSAGTVKNCTNTAAITSTGSNVGGVVAYSSSSKIENCTNSAPVNGNFAGGIAGNANGTSTIVACYNTGAVNGTSYIGGIVGYGENYYGTAMTTITACYNTGDITASNTRAGGIAGNLLGANLSDCYNSGTVTAGSYVGGALGYWSKGTVSRIYYLEGTAASDSYAEALTADELKEAYLDAAYFAGTCDGYPALLWQSGATFHEEIGTGEVTAPTCTEHGYSSYTCNLCGEKFVADFVDALGHDWCEHEGQDADCTDCVYTAPNCTEAGSIVRNCRFEGCDELHTDEVAALGHDWCEHEGEDTGCTHCVYTAPTCTEEGSIVRDCRFEGCGELHTDVVPATGHTEDTTQTVPNDHYKDCVCSVCGEEYTVWDYAILQYMEGLTGTIKADATVEDNDYPWTYNAETGRMESSNKGVDNSTSQTIITVTPIVDTVVSFDYGVSSEPRYDTMTITAAYGDTTEKIANAISGTTEDAFEYTLTADTTYTLTFAYSKDSSAGRNSDIGWFSDMKFVSVDEIQASAVEELIAAIGSDITLANGDAAIQEARTAYDALTDAQKALVENIDTLTSAEATYKELEDVAIANATPVTEKIAAIGEITLENGDTAIKEARAAYDALSEEEKAYVENYDVLYIAENTYKVLVAEAAVKKAEEAAAQAKAEAEAAAKEAAEKAEAAAQAKAEAEAAAKAEAEAAAKAKEEAEKALAEANKKLEEAEKAKEAMLIASVGETDLTVKNASNTSIKLTWDKLPAADGYIIWRATGNGEFKQIKTINSKKTVSYTDKGLKCGTTYVYKIQGFKKMGDEVVYGEMSDEAKLKAKPVATKITSLKKGKKKVTIKWKKVSGASGYVIYRSTKKNSGYKAVKTIKKASTVKWTNKKLKSKKKYYYKVRAYKTVNGKRVYSSYSAVKSVKTK